jgi:hypothetical protein
MVMITYKQPWPETLPALKVPVLHRVDYGYDDMGSVISTSIAKLAHDDIKVRAWCKHNCRAAYYLHPGYTREKFVHFEDDQDAVFFALKWA